MFASRSGLPLPGSKHTGYARGKAQHRNAALEKTGAYKVGNTPRAGLGWSWSWKGQQESPAGAAALTRHHSDTRLWPFCLPSTLFHLLHQNPT